MPATKSRMLRGCLLGCALGTAPMVHAHASEFGLALTSIYYGPYEDPADCPSGLAQTPDEVFYESLSPAERKIFKDRDKRVGSMAQYLTHILSRRMAADGKDYCESPTSLKVPAMPTAQSKKAPYGSDLDHGDKSSTCAHDEFQDGAGQAVIDNQLYRLMACVGGVRKENNRHNQNTDALLRSGSGVTLLRVTGVDNMQNDDDVTVGIYKSADRFIKDGSGEPLPDATMRADKGAPTFQSMTKGKIVNGTLITTPVDARLVQNPGDYFIKGASFQISLNEKGYGEGILTGYYDTGSFWDSWKKQGGQQRELGFTCPALYEALNRLADGYKDSSGKCTAISSAFKVKAVRTFVVPVDKPGDISELETPTPSSPTQLAFSR